MRLFAVTTAHVLPETIAASFARFVETAGDVHPARYIVVSHWWPLSRSSEIFHESVTRIARIVNGEVVRPTHNLGSHEGFNFGLKTLGIEDDDLILGYDADSYPCTQGWLRALCEIMASDQTLGSVSLLHNAIAVRPWKHETIGGHRVVSLLHPEMVNVTLWRGKVLREKGLQALSDFYGFVEVAMAKEFALQKLRGVYAYDFREDFHPIQQPKIYVKWKEAHAFGRYKGNFDAYVKEFGHE